MIQTAQWSDRPSLEKLWHQCFPEDSDAFIQLFFDRIYHPDRTLIDQEYGVIRAGLHMVPYRLNWFGRVLPVYALSGVATHPDYRRQGRAGALVNAALHHLHRQGIAIAFLYPFRASFYQPFGFETAYTRQVSTVTQTQAHPAIGEEASLARVMSLYEQAMQKRTAYAVRDRAAFEYRLADLLNDGAQLMVYDQGYAVIEYQKETLNVLEQAGDIQALAAALLRDTGARQLIMRDALPVHDADEVKEEAGDMLRLVDVRAALQGLPVRPMKWQITLEDENCPWNHGHYLLYADESGRLQVQEGEGGELVTPNSLIRRLWPQLTGYPMQLFETY